MRKYLILPILLVFILNSCNEDEGLVPTVNEPTINKKERISGFVQKGPFINGTSILINELNPDLSQTGKIFSTQITDNHGGFEIENIELVSNFVSLKADGFYFNETIGEQSNSRLTLYALSDLTDNSTLNTNVLSHLEKPRVEYLISQGSTFSEAKTQAQSEVLAIFNFNASMTEPSEVLDISQEGEDNAILLAASIILQGYRTEGELTELLSNISLDLREDGVLDNTALGSQLINHAFYLDNAAIKGYLEDRYSEIGVDAEIPKFEGYVQNFIDSTAFEVTESLIEYPATGAYGENILALDKETYNNERVSLAAKLTNKTTLKIKITAMDSTFFGYSVGSSQNWSISEYDYETRSQYYTSIDSDKNCDLNMLFESGTFIIEYFEMGATEPTRTKTIVR
jgi:hypothetical protein